MKQSIYNIIDDIFKHFMIDNKEMLNALSYNYIINIVNKEIINGFFFFPGLLLRKPFNIRYIGKRSSVAGDFYIFFNEEMDKIYTYFEANKL